MPPTHGWHSRSWGLPTPDGSQIRLVGPSSALLCQRASIGDGLRPLTWLNAGGCSVRQGAGVLCDMWLIVGWWRGCAPSSSNGLTFGCCAIDNSLSWGHGRSKRDFWEIFLGENLECKYWDLNENPILWWRFFTASDQMVDPYHKQECVFKV